MKEKKEGGKWSLPPIFTTDRRPCSSSVLVKPLYRTYVPYLSRSVCGELPKLAGYGVPRGWKERRDMKYGLHT